MAFLFKYLYLFNYLAILGRAFLPATTLVSTRYNARAYPLQR
jgi:hypothetical protein